MRDANEDKTGTKEEGRKPCSPVFERRPARWRGRKVGQVSDLIIRYSRRKEDQVKDMTYWARASALTYDTRDQVQVTAKCWNASKPTGGTPVPRGIGVPPMSEYVTALRRTA